MSSSKKRKEGETLKDKGEIVTEDTEVEVPVKRSKKEQGVEKLTPFLAQTIKECIDISAEPDESLLIKVRPNVPLHQALTEDELDLELDQNVLFILFEIFHIGREIYY